MTEDVMGTSSVMGTIVLQVDSWRTLATNGVTHSVVGKWRRPRMRASTRALRFLVHAVA